MLPKPRRRIKVLPIILGIILLPILVLAGWFGFLYFRPQLERLSFFALPQQTPTEAAPLETEPALAQTTPTSIATLEPTASSPAATPTESAAIPDCLEWSSVTLDHLDQQICVQGEYIQQFKRGDGTFVMVFSDDPGTFQIWSYPKPFDWYTQESDAPCVVAHGWVQTSGVRPIIILGSRGTMEACP
ncbi:MAG: hypothetical protein IT297_01135 [Anaerolineae bacterium]|nr:hypothetical protein [Anaerolineae bacterium]